MLQTKEIAGGETGKVLAKYLIDFLPFETETETMVESVRMALQPGLLDEAVRQDLWKKAGRKSAYLLGFLAATPEDLPGENYPRSDHERYTEQLGELVRQGNQTASLLNFLLSSSGQGFLDTALRILEKPPTQDIVNTTLDVVREYLSAIRPEGDPDLTIEELDAEARVFLTQSEDAAACLQAVPELEAEIVALRVLSGGGYGVLRPVLKGSTAVGSLMRRKLAPVLDPYLLQIKLLLGRSA